MKTFIKPQIDLPTTAYEDPRVGHVLGRQVSSRNPARAVLLGFPGDQGVQRAGGRAGAGQGPDAIRRELFRMAPDGRNPAFREFLEHVQDLGNLQISGDVEQDQTLLGMVLAPYLKENVIPIILGGGHEVSYGHFLGYVHSQKNVSVLSLSSRPQVADLQDGLAHSGSPFRQVLLDSSQCCRVFTVAGLQPHEVAATHLDFITNRNGNYIWARSLSANQIDEIYSTLEDQLMASFDLSALDQSLAPGVSSPTVGGLSAQLWLQAAFRAGKNNHISSFDLVEMNPHFDSDRRTARLAALTVWRFLSGLTERLS